ncbi:MAG TPA: glycosyl transferase family 2 [Bacteroidales bacterium]|nr:glycosyl transferase family 2 [Bacteroidales bacterium]
MKQAIVIQARLGSTRMPGKILKDFYQGESILGIQCRNLGAIPDTGLIIATSTAKGDDPIVDFCRAYSIQCFRGSENDVLQRYISCSDEYGLTHIIRVCSDNPFLGRSGVIHLLEIQRQNKGDDYIAYRIGGKPSILTHFGLWGEAVSVAALKKAASQSSDKFYHEHVTNYLYHHPEEFKLKFIDLGEFWEAHQQFRFTVDTPDDFNNMAALYAHAAVETTPEVLIEKAMEIPGLSEAMIQQIKQNTK